MPFGRKRPSRVPPGETETWMSCSRAAAAKGAPLKLLSPSRSPSKPSAANRGRVGRIPARSSVLAGCSSRSSSEPCLSQAAKTLTPLISLPPSIPRAQALGAERSEWLSTTTAEGSPSSPQASRQSSARRWPRRRQPQTRPAGKRTVQSRKRNAGEQTGDAPLHAAEGQHPDQPNQAPPQAEIRLASTAVHADPLTVHGLQFGLDREDEHLDVGQDVPAITAAGAGNGSGRRGRHLSATQVRD